jgi:hypothetical protein
MKCLDGELLETKYEWPEKKSGGSDGDDDEDDDREMIEKAKTYLKKNGTCYINGTNRRKIILAFIQIFTKQSIF